MNETSKTPVADQVMRDMARISAAIGAAMEKNFGPLMRAARASLPPVERATGSRKPKRRS